MSVFFLYPLFLFGLAAASLPVLIHLLNRRKLKRIRFPAVRFILLSQKRISRSYRLRHWLLLGAENSGGGFPRAACSPTRFFKPAPAYLPAAGRFRWSCCWTIR